MRKLKFIRCDGNGIVCKNKDCSFYNQPTSTAIGVFDGNKLAGLKCAYCRDRINPEENVKRVYNDIAKSNRRLAKEMMKIAKKTLPKEVK